VGNVLFFVKIVLIKRCDTDRNKFGMDLSKIILLFILTIVLLIAAVNDIRFHKIPNWLTYPSIIIGIFYNTINTGFDGLLFSIGGVGVGIGVMILFYLMAGTGAGDVKLMGAVGGFLGPKGVFIAFLSTSIVGGIYAIILLISYGYLKEVAKRLGATIKTFILIRRLNYIPSIHQEKKPKLCYGLAIALGTIISVALGFNI